MRLPSSKHAKAAAEGASNAWIRGGRGCWAAAPHSMDQVQIDLQGALAVGLINFQSRLSSWAHCLAYRYQKFFFFFFFFFLPLTCSSLAYALHAALCLFGILLLGAVSDLPCLLTPPNGASGPC